jgi:subtilisin family serine protease
MSAIAQHSCIQAEPFREDPLATKKGEVPRRVKLRRTEFKYPFLASWPPEPQDPAGEPLWAVATNLLVKFQEGIDAGRARSILQKALKDTHISTGFDVRPLPLSNLFLVHATKEFPGIPTDGVANYSLAGISAVAEHPEVVRVTPDFLHFSFPMSTYSIRAPTEPVTMDLDRIGALKAWERVTGSRKIRVAVLDTGVAANHRALKDNILRRLCKVVGYNFYDRNSNSEDDNVHGHGTFCAGLIGGKEGIGVNHKVSILPVKWLSSDGCGCVSDAIEAIEFAIRHRARVLSNSWGSVAYSPDLEEKIAQAGSHGILFVAGAGNEDRDLDQCPHLFPAAYPLPNVISVGATKDDDTAAVPVWGHASRRVHLSAPGVTVYSAILDDRFGEGHGTSASTAYVAGACALLMAAFPQFTYQEIRTRLLASATPLAQIPPVPASCTNRRLDLANAVFANTLYPIGCC